MGASSQPDKVGYDVLHNLLGNSYKGQVLPVNPHGGQIQGAPALHAVAELPPDLDLAVGVVPAAMVPQTVE